jgi:hypothetical protein
VVQIGAPAGETAADGSNDVREVIVGAIDELSPVERRRVEADDVHAVSEIVIRLSLVSSQAPCQDGHVRRRCELVTGLRE